MLNGQSFHHHTILKALMAGLVVVMISSCAAVKNYPPNKPFVYKTNINLSGNFSKEEKESLESRLRNQLDDSVAARSVSKFFRSVIINPPVYDSANADKSVVFMRNLLNKLGYFKDTITYTSTIEVQSTDQYRTTLDFEVKPGKLVRLDSISYNIDEPELQRLTISRLKESNLKKGSPFDQSLISQELDRLVDIYRDSGYMRFSREELIGVWDTLDVSLLLPTRDIFEQLEILQKLKERRENPKANLEIKLRNGIDTTKLQKYFIRDITVEPDFPINTALGEPDTVHIKGIDVVYNHNHKPFRPGVIPENIFFHSGETYSQQTYFKTINRFNSLGAWLPINIVPIFKTNGDSVDFELQLVPAKKYNIITSLEGSRNQSAISGNLFGLALNVQIQNRNFQKSEDQTSTNVRYGVELGGKSGESLVQTQQFVFSHSIYIPRPIPKFKWIRGAIRDNFRTVFNFNAAYTDRKDLYNLVTVNGSWGYETSWKKNYFSLRVPNVEYSSLLPRPALDTLFTANPSLRNVFTDGVIASTLAGFTTSFGPVRNVNIVHANLEMSGLLLGFVHNKFLDTNLYRYVKADLELAKKIQFVKTAIAFRFFAGVGYEFNSTVNPRKRNNLPFFKQFFSGGPNSMRAWGLRQLGPGSTVKDFTGTDAIPERYGDVQLEGNIEYRFPIGKVWGVKLNGALFTDIGNVWLLKNGAGPPEQVFHFDQFVNDLAVGAGAGLRIDFNFLVIRFDYSYKVRDPSPKPENIDIQYKWFGYRFLQKDATQFQLGISYPFIL